MPGITEGGVRIFSAASSDALENMINIFLAGSGSIDDRKKSITQAPIFLITGGVFYAFIVYKTIV